MHHRQPGREATAFAAVMAGQCSGGTGSDLMRREPGAEAIRAALSDVASSPGFARSPRLQRFLRYIVEESLAGRGGALKEYSIAVDVFERDASYDPQTNSLVRVEASRLRAKLDKYNSEAKEGGVVITLPTGSYVPVFKKEPGHGAGDAAKPAPISAPRKRTVLSMAIAATVGVIAVLIAGHWSVIRDSVMSVVTAEGDAIRVAEMPTIAVLPLRNISDEVEDDFLGEGLTDALITSLARQASVRVIAFSSSRPYRDGVRAVDGIARELGVSHVVEGTVLREGGTVRISAKLIEAGTGRYLWAESYDRQIVELLSLQADLARQIVTSLAAVVTADTTRPAERATVTADPAAQEAYLMGRYFRNMATEDGFHKGIAYFKDAIAREPDFAEAYSGMAACYCVLGGHGFELVDPREGMPQAKRAIAEAMRLNDGLAEAHAFAGIIQLKYDWDWAGAERSFRRSIALNPSYAQAHLFYSYYLEAMGDEAGAVREAEEARRLDPLSLPLNVNLVWQYLRADRVDAALERLDWAHDLNPDFWGVHWAYGHYYRRMGDLEKSLNAFERAVAVGGGHALPIADLGYTYAVVGRAADARRMLDRLKSMAATAYVSPYNMAVIHIGLGEVDDAFATLDAAYHMRSRSLAWLNVAREFDGVRGDPRFRALTERVGLPL